MAIAVDVFFTRTFEESWPTCSPGEPAVQATRAAHVRLNGGTHRREARKIAEFNGLFPTAYRLQPPFFAYSGPTNPWAWVALWLSQQSAADLVTIASALKTEHERYARILAACGVSQEIRADVQVWKEVVEEYQWVCGFEFTPACLALLL